MENNSGIFLSYSSANSNLAMRIAEAIERSGGQVWWYEKYSEPGNLYQNNYLERIQKSEYFVLLDSKDARDSRDVQLECQQAYSTFIQKGNPAIQVCLIEENKNNWRQHRSLAEFNQFDYVDFSNIDVFDDKSVYLQSINRLADAMGIVFHPWSTSHRSADFEKEIYHLSLKVEQREILLGDFENYQKVLHQDYEMSYRRLQLIKDTLVGFGIPDTIRTYYFAKGALELELGLLEKSRATFKRSADLFPHDPRCWEGVATSAYYLGLYEEADKYINKAQSLIQEYYSHNSSFQTILKGLSRNYLKLLLAREYFSEFKQVFESLSSAQKQTVEYKILWCLYLTKKKLTKKALAIYEQIKTLVNHKSALNPKGLNFLLAELEYNLGRNLFEKRWLTNNKQRTQEGKMHLENAFSLEPDNVRYGSELALFYRITDNRYLEEFTLRKVMRLTPRTQIENYFYGLAKFLSGLESEASNYYERSKKFQWPQYKSLLKSA